jgi:hypothetical protein
MVNDERERSSGNGKENCYILNKLLTGEWDEF